MPRYIKVASYFSVENNWMDKSLIAEVLNGFFSDEGLNTEEERDIRAQWTRLTGMTTRLDDQNCYIILHDYIAQLMGVGLLPEDTFWPIPVFSKAFGESYPKGNPIRDVNFAAAARYVYHAKDQLMSPACMSRLAPHLNAGNGIDMPFKF
ncbi:hypothetical protein PG987_002158 [Apiospora arundinis]